ncbi:TVP38/TMEM64 family protein [Cryptosporangium phraense]|uniref:TVP38/TMEM64 family membrane protein n=1 Tax=Cryptosporangium phraense TaxID=2593070 RepID=A0A545AMR3_9ACTN|nr:VTT domain-containing protein [Cryptosporangium phraense]TQS42551.1 TVP38/TMEM64 family protein [Cryptosporangium phraense]
MTSPAIRAVTLGVLLLVLVGFLLTYGVPEPSALRSFVADAGPWTPIGVAAVAVVTSVAMAPRGVPALLAGLLLPPVVAVGAALCGIVVGASVAFLLGRWLGRPYLSGRTAAAGPDARLARLQAWLDRDGTRAVVYARILPVFPFGLLNYLFGATTVRMVPFVFGTAAAIVPSTTAYVLVGASASDPGSPAFFFSVGLVALVGALGLAHAWWARRRARATPEAQLALTAAE